MNKRLTSQLGLAGSESEVAGWDGDSCEKAETLEGRRGRGLDDHVLLLAAFSVVRLAATQYHKGQPQDHPGFSGSHSRVTNRELDCGGVEEDGVGRKRRERRMERVGAVLVVTHYRGCDGRLISLD